MARIQKDTPKVREAYPGAQPLRYEWGRLYYVKNEMIDKIANIPSQQRKLKCPPPPLPPEPEAA